MATLVTTADCLQGAGSPEGVVTALPGQLYMDTATGTVYAKKSGSGSVNWVAQGGTGSGDGLGTDGDKGDVTVGGTGTTLTIDNNAVTYAKMQDVSAGDKVIGRISGAGDPEEIACTAAGRSMIAAASASAQTALLSAMVGDSGAGGTKGLAPAPAAGDAAAGKFLKADGTWAAPTGGSGLTHPQVLARSMGA